MSNGQTPFVITIDHSLPVHKPSFLQPQKYPVMWRNILKIVSSQTPVRYSLNPHTFFRACSSIGVSQDSIFQEKLNFGPDMGFPDMGFRRNGEFLPQDEFLGRPSFGFLRNQVSFNGLCPKSYMSVAEAVSISSTDAEDDAPVGDEVHELLEEIKKEDKREGAFRRRVRQRKEWGMSPRIYNMLRKRQVKIETEAWEQAAKEYKELIADMCEQKLAPTLPYMKSLFLGWFDPLREKIVAEQELCRLGKNKAAYAPYFDQLPADMMSVITMHKLMGLLMTGGEHGGAKVVGAACLVGEAIEQEVRIHQFLEKTKKEKVDKNTKLDGDGSSSALEEQVKLRKKVTDLMKKQKLHAVNKIVKKQDESKPWSQDARAKVGSRLIELLMQTAYIQPPADQLADGPPDIRPAFTHTLRTVVRNAKNTSRRYGVIECDPLVLMGLERTARHMVIPYIPMLVPPVKWTGYDKGGHLFLPSYVMRTHGARQQREAIRRTPREQLQPVFEALDTLGRTKWRVNKRVLGVVDKIWASGGHLADLVDRNDIPLPDKPDTEDESLLMKWKWKVRSVKKENGERHSQRCDLELKLAMDVLLENRPLEGKRWWLKAEDPFQFLAVCINLSEALRSSSPEAAISHIPVHQDGSCNGLQHYAALGRDKLGAGAVNLIAGEKPADVYSGIAARVLDIMRTDAQKDPAVFPDALRARILMNQVSVRSKQASPSGSHIYNNISHRVQADDPSSRPLCGKCNVCKPAYSLSTSKYVDRKLVKQTVMTSVYGVTYIGARDQIKRRLKERNAIEDDTELFGAACYAAKITLTALGEMFQAARGIMSWLGDCAKIIELAFIWLIILTCLTAMIILLPLRISQWNGRLPLDFLLCSLTVNEEGIWRVLNFDDTLLLAYHYSCANCQLPKILLQIMVKRQRTAFPPNFVHSLDGSHMMMTAVACKKAGLNFAGVHDSYWTHACDVEEMNRILREKFVELYETPILENVCDTVALYGFTVSVLLCYVDRHRKERGHSLNIICERLEALLTLSCENVLER
ncbi:hypothetical protein RHGRI_028646 [Rhododendron griersonianum]|uniref:DNA-directed RNA polymerase n=1 Tax=Rhododendron griersonianum TaxID=479676 RepID=A0AAV6IGM1_9ERIC|nr:hypothetical protein RHGRI_028646 [Rhododendron griersonianum]